MRVTNQFLFDNFKSDHSKVLKELNKLTTQVSSGQKIQNSYEDSAIYADILRFESQENELSSIKERAVAAQSFADASDSILSEFNQTLRDFKTKLLSAANGTLNSDNLEAISIELEEKKKHMISLANSQVNGQYIFSGTAVNSKPIDNNGVYHGNDGALMTLVGDGVEVQNNIDGKSLFLGDDLSIHKSIQTNVKLTNKISNEPLTTSNSIREMVGDSDTDETNDKSVHFFISGTTRDGKAFKDVVEIDANKKVDDLLSKISDSFGGDVKTELSPNGNIVITDLKSGYSQIDFKMVGIQGLNPPSERDLNSATGDKIIDFVKSDFRNVDPSVPDSLQMDKFYFQKNGSKLEGNVPLIADGSFATSTTKLSEMAGASLDGKSFEMKVKDIDGVEQIISLDLSSDSTFSVGGYTYNIYNADENSTHTDADSFTMGQLNNIISMTLSKNLPASNSPDSINSAIVDAKKIIDVDINQNGHLEINDNSNDLSNIEFSFYDKDANDFTKSSTPSISMMSNNAVITSQSHLSFFDELDSVIDAVKNGVVDVDSKSDDPRSIGIKNSIGKLDQMSNHFNNAQSQIGVRSKSLQYAQDKAATLEINVKQLKADATEVDIAETITKLNQTTLSYQAMLQTITKVNSLTLLNYLK